MNAVKRETSPAAQLPPKHITTEQSVTDTINLHIVPTCFTHIAVFTNKIQLEYHELTAGTVSEYVWRISLFKHTTPPFHYLPPPSKKKETQAVSSGEYLKKFQIKLIAQNKQSYGAKKTL